MTLRDLIYDLGGGIPDGRELKAVVPGGSSTVILTKDEIDVGYDFDSLGQLRTAMGSAGIVVLDDRCCIVQLGIRFSEFYEHESCGKCTPCREGTRWLTAILRKLEDGRAHAGRPRSAARRLRPHQRQVSLPARRLRRDHRRELRREVPRRSSRRTSTRAAARSAASPRSTTCSRRSRCTRTLLSPRCPREPTSSRSRSTSDGEVPKGTGMVETAQPPASRSPSSVTSRGSGRRSAPAACASSRWKGCRSCRPAAR